MTQREEFENWFFENTLMKYEFSKEEILRTCDDLDECGDYYHLFVRTSWLAWQAAKQHAVPEWIPVSERLPENEGTYFCLGHNGTPFVCLLRNKKYEGKIWLRSTGTKRVVGITHWMPLPAAPEQNK